jgi:predicted esterase
VAHFDDPYYKDKPGYDAEFQINLEVIVHPLPKASAIVINYPGVNGDINGYNNKYGKMAEMLHEKGFAAIQMGNAELGWFLYEKSVVEDLRAVIKYAIENASRICGNSNPDICLMGFSAGASAVAAVCADFPQVKKILLVAPSGDASESAVTRGLSLFSGEVYITVGEDDEIVGQRAGEFFAKLVKRAVITRLCIIPTCDHQFRGTTNGKIMSKAPLWAFADDTSYPSPEGGIVLY